MVLVDSSVWVDHLRIAEPELNRLLMADEVLGHTLVSGEIALGTFKDRLAILEKLDKLPQAVMATDEEVWHFIEAWKLFGRGVGYVDVHLLAAAQLTPGAVLWTRDKRLRKIARLLGSEFYEAKPS